jgi:MFS family permease
MKPAVSSVRGTRISPKRVVVVGLGLMATGATVGAACGVVSISLLLGVGGRLPDPDVALIAGLFGGALGAVLGPAAGFSILRRVPLGRAIGWTALGATLGAVIGAPFVMGLILGPVVGFGVASLAPWASARRSRGAG